MGGRWQRYLDNNPAENVKYKSLKGHWAKSEMRSAGAREVFAKYQKVREHSGEREIIEKEWG
eukprot:12499014-Alexandrium_andersonii.AAC.1